MTKRIDDHSKGSRPTKSGHSLTKEQKKHFRELRLMDDIKQFILGKRAKSFSRPYLVAMCMELILGEGGQY